MYRRDRRVIHSVIRSDTFPFLVTCPARVSPLHAVPATCVVCDRPFPYPADPPGMLRSVGRGSVWREISMLLGTPRDRPST